MMKAKHLYVAAMLAACVCSCNHPKHVHVVVDADSVAVESDSLMGFDFEKYRQAFLDKAELPYCSSDEVLKLESYALIDIDHDGNPEVWVRGNMGQWYEGVYAVVGDSVTLLASGDLLFYDGAVGYCAFWQSSEETAAVIVQNSRPAGSYSMTTLYDPANDELTLEDCRVNGEPADSATCAAFEERLGIRKLASEMEKEVTWNPVE